MPHHAFESTRRAMTSGANQLTSRAMSDDGVRAIPATVPSAQLRAFVDALDRLGFAIAPLLANVGLRRSELDDPDAMIPSSAVDGVINRACEQRRLPNLGAHLAAVTPIGAHALLDFLVVTTDTVGGALEQLVRYFHLADAPVRLAVAHDSDASRLVVHSAMCSFVVEYSVSLAVHRLREETERRLRVSSVSLAHEPDDVSNLEQLLDCPVHAPSTWSGVELTSESLRLPLRRGDRVLRGVLEGHAAGVTVRAPIAEQDSTVSRVRAVLASRLGHGVPTIHAIARQLATSPRTLQRRLATEGIAYERLVDVVRRESAERLLADASISAGEIGYLLGFSEPSAFHRAFKRWHGITPQEYRGTRPRGSSEPASEMTDQTTLTPLKDLPPPSRAD